MKKSRQYIAKRVKEIPRKFIYEILIVAGGLFILALVVSLLSPYVAPKEYAIADSENTSTTILRATVESISEDFIQVTLNDGPSKGTTVNVPIKSWFKQKSLQPGSNVVLTNMEGAGGLAYYDLYRIPILIFIVGLFVAVVLLVGRRKGLMSLAGLGASIVVIIWVIVPLVVAGYNSLLVSVAGAFVIAIVSILVAHGFNKRTFVSLLCVLIVLLFVVIGSQIVVALLGLTGMIDEASYYLQNDHPNIDLSGILVGGIVIAALGALDDIVTTQVATVDELKKVDRSLDVKTLYQKASSVGGEHIAALINTLALVYVGAALPVIVSYAVSTPDIFLLFNSEFVATEIARTIIVSIGLVLSVPISTFMAAIILSKNRIKK